MCGASSDEALAGTFVRRPGTGMQSSESSEFKQGKEKVLAALKCFVVKYSSYCTSPKRKGRGGRLASVGRKMVLEQRGIENKKDERYSSEDTVIKSEEG